MPDTLSEPDVPEAFQDPSPGTTRRTLLRGAVIAGVSVPVIAACGGGDDEPSATEDTTASSAPQSSEAPPTDAETPDGGGGGADAIATTSDVPEGGGIIVAESGIVITQPTAGEFKGFTNICTHQSCKLDNVSEGTINCICHGSQFSIEDGTPVTGPSGQPADSIAPLPEKPVTVQGDNISLA